jgi:hypothetical protein
MEIITGFYNTEILTKAKQKSFMKEAIFLSYKTLVESKYIREGSRTEEPFITVAEAMKICHSLKAVDRTIQFGKLEPYGEVSLITTSFEHPVFKSSIYGKGWLLLYCYLSVDNLDKLAKKYNLIKT